MTIEDAGKIDHELLKSMGITIAKDRLLILEYLKQAEKVFFPF